MELVQALFEPSIDLIGDVHGEFGALQALLNLLGYSPSGTHPERRRLVFLGDLVDRGPHSPQVVRLVQMFVAKGRAQCILGNHELNLLQGHRKRNNRWFFGEPESCPPGNVPTQLLPEEDRPLFQEFFSELPVVLEGNHLRVVHACWDARAVERAKNASNGAVYLCAQSDDEIAAQLAHEDLEDGVDRNLRFQNDNPIKLLTSGQERRSKVEFEAGGKVRREERVPWWQTYTGKQLCVFGHYRRIRLLDESDPDGLFPEKHYQSLLGQGNAFCLDFSIGQRSKERAQVGPKGPFRTRLAALRYPEMEVVCDNGWRAPLTKDWSFV